MSPTTRFVLSLLLGLGLLTWLAYDALVRTNRTWFESDLDQRAHIAVASARQSLRSGWRNGVLVGDVLADITRDERIMGAAACTETGELRAATQAYPDELRCGSITARTGTGPSTRESWSTRHELLSGPVHLTVVPLSETDPSGFVVLVQDLSFLSRREATMRNQALMAFLVLAAGASALTLLAAKFARRSWMRELHGALIGEQSGDFTPLLRDVRELVEKLNRERYSESLAGPWTAARLRAVLKQYLQGERIVVVANREPYIHEKNGDGPPRVLHPASGLVTALEPVMRACSGVWVAHGSGTADRETVDAKDRVRVPPGEESYLVRRVWLTEEEEAGYYYGFSNEGLWPLCHIAHTRPEFRQKDWDQYRRVNEKFANAVCTEVDADDSIILVQDYHFALAPAIIRERLPRATILTFWHIPWPNAERLGICPWREDLLDGLLGSSILGFHTQQHCNNFLDAADTYLEARIDRESNAVVQRSRRTLVRPYPISIEWPVHWLNGMPPSATCRREVLHELGLPPETLLGVGVDRLDYTKGIEERLLAVDQFLERYPEHRGRFVFVQLGAPSRTRIGRYRELETRVQEVARTINDRWSRSDYHPIVFVHKHYEPAEVFRLFRAADLCYVSSLHDGMNLVAKEFVAARDDERGVLVLSQFAGAAKELTEALIVNPYDLRQASDAFATALSMSPTEQRERMRSMRGLIAELNVYRWAGRMLAEAGQLRRRVRVTGRLSTPPPFAVPNPK